jgi:hypothetical protein
MNIETAGYRALKEIGIIAKTETTQMYIEIKVVNEKGKIIDLSRISVAFPIIFKDWSETPIFLEEEGSRIKTLIGYEFKPIMIWQDRIKI